MLERLQNFPTTQGRVVVTLAVYFGTAVRYWVGGWSPSWDWLIFIGIMSGLDLTQFHVKRVTDHGYVERTSQGKMS